MAENTRKHYYPIGRTYALILVITLTLLVAALYTLNRTYLPHYYQQQKLFRLDEVEKRLERYLENGRILEEELDVLRRCETYGIDVIVIRDMGAFSSVVLGTVDSGSAAGNRLLELVRSPEAKDGPWAEAKEIFSESDHYRTYRIRDAVTGTDQIDCIGRLSIEVPSLSESGKPSASREEYFFVLTVPMAFFRESVQIVNLFLLIMGGFTALLGSLAVWKITQRITLPIRRMSDLSQKMAALDFSARYEGNTKNELQILGENMNEMASALEKSMTELKNANARLEADIREKEKIAKQRQELLANISHELKTPLALIEGYSEGLKDGVCTDDASREAYCSVILDETQRMNRLVRQLLSIDELESGNLTIERESFDLAGMLRGMAASYQLPAKEKNITLLTELPESLIVESDEFLLEQVVQNYLSNAFQHVSENGTVRLSCGTKKGQTWLSVYNTGEAIPEQYLDAIWEKFFKVDKARTRAYGGSGIGLSLVKASMDRLGGGCKAQNTEGGVEFSAWF